MISFIQPFGLFSHDQGGSPKVLQALLDTDHPPLFSINTDPCSRPDASPAQEIRLPSRPNFARLEYTRLQGSLGLFDRIYRRRFEARLRRVLLDREVKLVHVIPHDYSFQSACSVASELGLPYFLSIHDDLEYLRRGHILLAQMTKAMGRAWRGAKGVFAISDEIAQEYCRRYGARDYRTVTDGLKQVADAPRERRERSLRVYFMGLFHNSSSQSARGAGCLENRAVAAAGMGDLCHLP